MSKLGIATQTTTMSVPNEPPTYSQLPDTQLLIIPSSNAIQFQDGFLGADERSSVEGEVHVKGAMPGDWSRLYVLVHWTSVSLNELLGRSPWSLRSAIYLAQFSLRAIL